MPGTNTNSTGQYFNTVSDSNGQVIAVMGNAEWGTSNGLMQYSVTLNKNALHPELYFKYIKSKFRIIEKMKLDARLKRLEKAFLKAVENGQETLGNKLLTELAREARETTLYSKGIKHFIEKEDLDKHKRNIRGGHISDTKYDNFTRVIPDNVIKRKKELEDFFDGFVIYHYWDEKAEEKKEKSQKITPEEKSKMRDPVLFGVIRETNRLYFIIDWEDEYCDLSFEELIDHLGKGDEESTIHREPKLES